jgi:hypothetical protein
MYGYKEMGNFCNIYTEHMNFYYESCSNETCLEIVLDKQLEANKNTPLGQ